MGQRFSRFLAANSGATSVEYGLIGGIVALAMITICGLNQVYAPAAPENEQVQSTTADGIDAMLMPTQSRATE
ncbi:hypothetical protein [Pseudovibrio sp. SPO723]|uniref:Flp family type IVb pilin n=1 Tax=Nesiotobacter zosterae TaxID=392721 RepID=UPI0029C58408|nr:hypothetical protein [Pseudovibrio sp. SPO723]MDX5592369.1 hypothetical protein [Pseudovibrio sp. SPO723]